MCLLKLHSLANKCDTAIALAFHVFEDENILRDVCRHGNNMFDDNFIIIVLQYCHVVYVTLPTHEVTRDETAATAGRVR